MHQHFIATKWPAQPSQGIWKADAEIKYFLHSRSKWCNVVNVVEVGTTMPVVCLDVKWEGTFVVRKLHYWPTNMVKYLVYKKGIAQKTYLFSSQMHLNQSIYQSICQSNIIVFWAISS